jgi:hypothetical protein
MELLIIISSIFRRYDFVLEQPDKPVCTSLRIRAHAVNRCYSLTPGKVSLGNLQNAKLASSAGIFFSVAD